MVNFNPVQMKAFVVALAGSGLSIITLIPLIIFLIVEERRKKKRYSRRLMINLLVSYLGFAVVVFGGGVHGVTGVSLGTPAILCNIQGWMVMYWDQIMNYWVLILAIDIYMNVIYRRNLEQHEWKVCAVGWLYPLATASAGLAHWGMIPSGSWCFIDGTYVNAILPMHHIFLIIVCISITCLYTRAAYVLWSHTRRLSQSTNFKSAGIESSTKKLLLFPCIHLLVEIPTLARRAYEFQHGTNTNLLYLQTVLIATQGFLNVIAYGIRRGTFTKMMKSASDRTSGMSYKTDSALDSKLASKSRHMNMNLVQNGESVSSHEQ